MTYSGFGHHLVELLLNPELFLGVDGDLFLLIGSGDGLGYDGSLFTVLANARDGSESVFGSGVSSECSLQVSEVAVSSSDLVFVVSSSEHGSAELGGNLGSLLLDLGFLDLLGFSNGLLLDQLGVGSDGSSLCSSLGHHGFLDFVCLGGGSLSLGLEGFLFSDGFLSGLLGLPGGGTDGIISLLHVSLELSVGSELGFLGLSNGTVFHFLGSRHNLQESLTSLLVDGRDSATGLVDQMVGVPDHSGLNLGSEGSSSLDVTMSGGDDVLGSVELKL